MQTTLTRRVISEGSGENARVRILVRAFAGRTHSLEYKHDSVTRKVHLIDASMTF